MGVQKNINKEKCSGGYFQRHNWDQLVSRIPDKLNLNIDRSKFVLRPEGLAIMTSVSSENKLAGSKITSRKQISTSKLEKYTGRHGYIPPSHA